jgi:hypothetical protein
LNLPIGSAFGTENLFEENVVSILFRAALWETNSGRRAVVSEESNRDVKLD